MKVCTVSGCDRANRARGLCNMHLQRVNKFGTADLEPGRREGVTKGKVPLSLEARLWRNVDKSGECWIWTGSRNRAGYGTISVHVEGVGRRPQIASRVAYCLASGPIPAGLVVRHRCDNPACVNPSHLETGTHADNMQDMRVRGRSATGEAHSQARLTWESVRNIRRRVAAGESRAALARELGVSSTAVDDVAAGKTWKETTA